MNLSSDLPGLPESDADERLAVRVHRDGECVFRAEITKPLQIGRQRLSEPPPFQFVPAAEGPDRLIVARLDYARVSREHVLLECVAGQWQATNVSSRRNVRVVGHRSLRPAQSCLIDRELHFELDTVVIEASPAIESDEFISLAAPTLPPDPLIANPLASLRSVDWGGSLLETLDSDFDSQQGEVLLSWLQATTNVFQKAASSPNFLLHAAKAVSEIAGMNHASVLRYENENWRVSAAYPSAVDSRETIPDVGISIESGTLATALSFQPSQRILRRILRYKRTFVYRPKQDSLDSQSLAAVEAVVAAPLMNEQGEVIGALYAERHLGHEGRPITKLDASLVELVACGVAAGLARLYHERQAMKARVQFEQFFGPVLALKLETDPNLLQGHDTEISVLFCDIEGFSRITERLPTQTSLQWINEALTALSECVIDTGGVLVDYVGDELMAMWGAPVHYPDHADRACRAALAMHRAAARVSDRWAADLGEPFHVRIGINSGQARVGNVGSDWKFKYGALGTTVNLASRVQGAAKQLRHRLIVTQQTRELLRQPLAARRLCRARMVNLKEPVTLYEIPSEVSPRWLALCRIYDAGLAAFEEGNFSRAQALANQLCEQFPDDGPAHVLAERVRAELQDSIWQFGK